MTPKIDHNQKRYWSCNSYAWGRHQNFIPGIIFNMNPHNFSCWIRFYPPRIPHWTASMQKPTNLILFCVKFRAQLWLMKTKNASHHFWSLEKLKTIGGVNIRQDLSPRWDRPGGQYIAAAITFSKIVLVSDLLKITLNQSTPPEFHKLCFVQLLVHEFSHHDTENWPQSKTLLIM